MTRAAAIIALVLTACTEPNPDYCPPEHFAECERAYLAAQGWVRAPDLEGYEVVQIRDMSAPVDMAPPAPRDLAERPDLGTAPDLVTVADMTTLPDMVKPADLSFNRACVGSVCPSACATPAKEWSCCAFGGVNNVIRKRGASCVDLWDCQYLCKILVVCAAGRCCAMAPETCATNEECCSGKCVNNRCAL